MSAAAPAALADLALPLAELAVRATLLLSWAFLADRALRRAPAAARHALWVAAFAGLALLPGLGAVLPGVALPVLPAGPVAGGGETSGDQIAAGGASAADGREPFDPNSRAAERTGAPARSADSHPATGDGADTERGSAGGGADAAEHGGPALEPAGEPDAASLPAASANARLAADGGDLDGVGVADALPRRDERAAPNRDVPVPSAPSWAAAEGRAAAQSDAPVPPRTAPALPLVGPAAGLLVALAAAGSLLTLLYLLLGLLRAALLLRRARPLDADPRWRGLLAEAVAAQRPRRAPGLAESEAIAVPVLCGLRRPTVVLPAAAGGWSDEDRRRVLAHEVAHAARRDGLWQVAARAVAALYWWHPMAWRALSRLVLAAELACDDRVLAGGAAGPDYARQLLALARRPAAGARTLAVPRPVTVAMARRPHLAVRVRALLDEARPRGPLPRAATFAAVGVVLGGALLVAPLSLGAAGTGLDVTDAPILPLFGAGTPAAGDGPGAEGETSPASGALPPPAGGEMRFISSASGSSSRSMPASSHGGGRAASGLDRAWVRESIARRAHRMTPLMRAVFAGDEEEARRLLDAGADPNGAVRGLGTPLILAADAGDAALVDLLLRRGADANRAETGGERPGDLQRTPLGSAARSGDPATLDRLLAAGAAVDAAPRGDGTPLMIAARYGFSELARRLLAAGADPDARIPADGTPLIEAARDGHLEVVELLLAAGAPPDTGVEGDGNPLIVAAAGGHREVFERLLAAGADPDVWVPGDESALYHAIERGDAWMVERLIAAGADVSGDWPEEDGPLELAAEAGNRRVVELLRQAGARR